MFGGALMVMVGILYLMFEDLILADFSSTVKSKFAKNHITRGLVGTQIGLIVLAMLVTRSSALSLQAKLGLPRGNQIVGWLVLGKVCYYLCNYMALTEASDLSPDAIRVSRAAK